nr:hypothetical protein [Tanacetum cinerariifolium]
IWSTAMKLALQPRNNFAFIDGSCPKSAYVTSDVLSAKWDSCNAVVLTWIMNSVSSDVYMGLVYSVDVESVCKELESTYDKVDGYVIFNLLQKISSIKQGGSSVADYHRLNSLWREFDAVTKLPTYTCDANKESDLHMGLDKRYLFVRSSLLTRDPLLEVSLEESHRGIPESSSVTKSKLNATSFVAKSSNTFKRGYPKETMGYYFYFLPENKIVGVRYAEFLEKNIISQKAIGRAIELEKFKMKIHHLLKTLAKFMLRLKVRLPQEEVARVCRSLQDACFCLGEVEKNMGSRVGGGEKLESGKRGVMRDGGKSGLVGEQHPI